MLAATRFFNDETASYSVITLRGKDGNIGVVGFIVWTKDDKVMNVEGFGAGSLDNDLYGEWISFVNRVISPNVGNRKKGGYVSSINKDEIRNGWIPYIISPIFKAAEFI
jgi:hypothetical protein